MYRAYNVSSKYQLLHREFETLKQFFHSYGFPQKLDESQNNKILNERFEPTVSEPNEK